MFPSGLFRNEDSVTTRPAVGALLFLLLTKHVSMSEHGGAQCFWLPVDKPSRYILPLVLSLMWCNCTFAFTRAWRKELSNEQSVYCDRRIWSSALKQFISRWKNTPLLRQSALSVPDFSSDCRDSVAANERRRCCKVDPPCGRALVLIIILRCLKHKLNKSAEPVSIPLRESQWIRAGVCVCVCVCVCGCGAHGCSFLWKSKQNEHF